MRTPAIGSLWRGRRRIVVSFTEDEFAMIRAEARDRDWPVGMVIRTAAVGAIRGRRRRQADRALTNHLSKKQGEKA